MAACKKEEGALRALDDEEIKRIQPAGENGTIGYWVAEDAVVIRLDNHLIAIPSEMMRRALCHVVDCRDRIASK